jgi:hypothetical protein
MRTFPIEGTGVDAEGGCHAVVSSPPRDLKMRARPSTKTIRTTIPNKLPREFRILLIAIPPFQNLAAEKARFRKQKAEDKSLPVQGSLRQLQRNFVVFCRFGVLYYYYTTVEERCQ